jgi:uncharacterized repeat protein (TIGR01451 family)
MPRSFRLNLIRLALGVLPALYCSLDGAPAQAAPQKIAEFNEKGSFLLIGNTSAVDCRQVVPRPSNGTVGDCGMNTDDTSSDVLFDATTGSADTSVLATKAGSTSQLDIPAGAIVVHAQLFWAAQLPLGSSAAERVILERPDGSFGTTIVGDPARPGLTASTGGRTYYQSTADVTKLVQRYGSGAYRVRAIPTVPLANVLENVAFVNWHMIVVYRKTDDPTRNIVLYRAMDVIEPMTTANTTLDGFLVPMTGFAGSLGVVGYEGDHDLVGDVLQFNGVTLTNALNPADNFFNSTRSVGGQAISNSGDLPQTSGQPASLSGIDLDVVDVSAQLAAGATSATVRATSSSDLFFLGGFATAISTLFPVFSESTKLYSNVSRPGQPVLPGDTVRYTIRAINTGSDTSIKTVLRDTLPPELIYIPGSTQITGGPNAGQKTDQAGDDQVDYDPQRRTLTVRLGTGADATNGGTVPVNEATVIEIQARVSYAVSGQLNNQAVISGQGERATMQNVLRPGQWLSGDGVAPSAPTSFTVDCQSDLQCPALAPRCDRSRSPARCACLTSADCPASTVCDAVSRRCTQCTASPAQLQNCTAAGLGAQCLPDNTCGCGSDADCGGRVCDLGSRKCPHSKSDLDVQVIPPSMTVAPGMTAIYDVRITNLGPDAVNNASILTQLPPIISGVTWTCMPAAVGAMCPAQSGSGPLPDTVSLASGGAIVYSLSIPVPADYTTESLPVKVTAVAPPSVIDPLPNNNFGVGDALLTRSDQPDLVLNLDGQPGKEPWSIEYTATATNQGTGKAFGAFFLYTAPEGSEITVGKQGDGWQCLISADKRVLSCERTSNIDPQTTTPPVVFQVKSPANTEMQAVTATVIPRDTSGLTASDKNPADNTVSKSFPLFDAKLAGGGVGCDIGTRGASSAPISALAGLALSCALLLRRRRLRA